MVFNFIYLFDFLRLFIVVDNHVKSIHNWLKCTILTNPLIINMYVQIVMQRMIQASWCFLYIIPALLNETRDASIVVRGDQFTQIIQTVWGKDIINLNFKLITTKSR